MRSQLALAVVAGLPLATAVASAGPLDSVLGVFRGSESAASHFSAERAHAEWEGCLAPGDVASGKQLYQQGSYEKIQACVACHGTDGIPAANAPMPRLGGVTADYIAKELTDYKTGRRKNDIMGAIARQMTPKDIGSTALYLASLPPEPISIAHEPPGGRGKQLQDVGDNTLAIPACGNCHGPQGRGTDRLLPPLAGLPADYIRTQLRAFKQGQRANDDLGVMRSIIHRLSDDDIRSVSDYYAGLRATTAAK